MDNSIIPVIYEDENILAVNKPAGWLVHPTRIQNEELRIKKVRFPEPIITDWLIEKYPEIKNVGDDPATRPGIVHRLDKNTSGVILIARNQTSFDYLKKLFQEHKIQKNYLALAYGEVRPKTGVIKTSISIKNGSVKRTVWQGRNEKEAITEYRVIKSIKYKVSSIKEEVFSLVEVMPKTGRTHQIRVHLASIGHSIVGDSLYGRKVNPFGLNRQFLHAESLEFNLTSGSRIKIEADLPEDLKNVIKKLNEEK